MNDRKLPAVFGQPLVQTVGRVTLWLVGVDTAGFVDDQQVLIFEKDQSTHEPALARCRLRSRQ